MLKLTTSAYLLVMDLFFYLFSHSLVEYYVYDCSDNAVDGAKGIYNVEMFCI